MPPLQSTIAADIPWGVIGELAFEGPLNAAPARLVADGTIGRFFTRDANGDAVQGGTGALLGVLANPKVYANRSGLLENANFVVSANSIGEFVEKTPGIWVNLTGPNPIKVGMKVAYITATGVLTAYDQSGTLPGGSVEIPGAVVVRYNSTPAANLACIALNGPVAVPTAPL